MPTTRTRPKSEAMSQRPPGTSRSPDPDALGLFDDEGAEAEFRAWWAETATVKPATRESVQELLDPRRLSWTGCRKAVETASALGARDLFERAALRAVRVAHDGDHKPSLTLRLVARHVLVAKCAEAALTNLAAALADGQARLQAVLDDARRVTSSECWSWG